ncbi:hypothetical protein THRCLA_11348, partial [Thraustotheca clavata]
MVQIKQSFASLSERRHLKKHAQPEHAYTGYVPSENIETEPAPVRGKIKHAIVGYQGHRHNKQDMIGVTFTKGLEKCTPAKIPKATFKKHQNTTENSGYGQFDIISGYGEFQAPRSEDSITPPPLPYSIQPPRTDKPKPVINNQKLDPAPIPSLEFTGNNTANGSKSKIKFAGNPASGVVSRTSGNNKLIPPPKDASSYGEIAKASCTGQFAPPPKEGSNYGAFAGASGYGQFAAPPKVTSGYGEFAGASGYGQFAAPPKAESNYGEFAGASGYGQFAAPPKATSGYGEF